MAIIPPWVSPDGTAPNNPLTPASGASPTQGWKDSIGFFWNEPPKRNKDDPTTEEVRRRIEERIKNGKRQLITRPLSGVKMTAIDWLWRGWIPRGYVTIWAGETGAGKTTVLTDIAGRVTTGAPWPDQPDGERRAPGTVLWLGSEDGMSDLTIPRLIACGADTSRVIEIEGVSEGGTRGSFSMQDDIEGVRDYLSKAKARGEEVSLLVIDPITSYLSGQRNKRVDINDAGQLRAVIEPWLKVAQEYNLAIVCVTHFGKDTTRHMMHRVLGTAAFAQTSRSLCVVVSRPDDGPFEKVLIQVKTNLPDRPGGALKFATERVTVGLDERTGQPIDATRPRWGEVDPTITAESMVAGASKPGPESKYAPAFGIWLRAQFLSAGGLEVELPLEALKREALSVVSSRWWDDHSKEYLNKENRGGTWVCRLKPLCPN